MKLQICPWPVQKKFEHVQNMATVSFDVRLTKTKGDKQFISLGYYIKTVRCTFKKNLWSWEKILYQNIVDKNIDN